MLKNEYHVLHQPALLLPAERPHPETASLIDAISSAPLHFVRHGSRLSNLYAFDGKFLIPRHCQADGKSRLTILLCADRK